MQGGQDNSNTGSTSLHDSCKQGTDKEIGPETVIRDNAQIKILSDVFYTAFHVIKPEKKKTESYEEPANLEGLGDLSSGAPYEVRTSSLNVSSRIMKMLYLG